MARRVGAVVAAGLLGLVVAAAPIRADSGVAYLSPGVTAAVLSYTVNRISVVFTGTSATIDAGTATTVFTQLGVNCSDYGPVAFSAVPQTISFGTTGHGCFIYGFTGSGTAYQPTATASGTYSYAGSPDPTPTPTPTATPSATPTPTPAPSSSVAPSPSAGVSCDPYCVVALVPEDRARLDGIQLGIAVVAGLGTALVVAAVRRG